MAKQREVGKRCRYRDPFTADGCPHPAQPGRDYCSPQCERLAQKNERLLSEWKQEMARQGLVVPLGSWSDEVYSVEDTQGWQWHWNVTEGQRIAQARGEVYTISLSEIGITVDFIRSQYTDLDETYALTTDLTKPLLFVPLHGKDQLINGWHRLFKAAACGVDVLLAYFLTQEEADGILLMKLPPGRGIDWGQRHASASGMRDEG